MASVNLDTVVIAILAYLDHVVPCPCPLTLYINDERHIADTQIQELKGLEKELGCSMDFVGNTIYIMKNGVTMHPYRTIFVTI